MLVNTPPMGWNTWNTFGSDISDALVRESADAIAELGLKDAGYTYVVIDDCWSLRKRDSVTKSIVPDPVKFPHGMKALADYVHGKGLKFGMYSCAGQRTCADYPGSFDHEFLDARTFAEWGVDFLKYDFCYRPGGFEGQLLYRRMGMALRESGRDILFSACNWGSDNVWQWIRSCGAHMYRSTGDIIDTPESFRNIAISQMDKLNANAPQCFNDMDMLTVGMYGKGNVGVQGMTAADYRSEFALWCMCGVPLMLGCDVRSLDKEMLALLKNRDLIAIDQDAECRQPIFLGNPEREKKLCVFRHLDGGKYAVAFFNFNDEARNVSFTFSDVGLSAASGLGLRFSPVLGSLEGTYSEYLNVTTDAHDCIVAVCEAVPV
ncbi:MAG: glycoside hydrolase family 27 protein [Clostridia bacterium]|nr:glycoside hydrolase family 27 protein [Clostridia bacterium]